MEISHLFSVSGLTRLFLSRDKYFWWIQKIRKGLSHPRLQTQSSLPGRLADMQQDQSRGQTEMPVSGWNDFLGVHPLIGSASAMCNKRIKSGWRSSLAWKRLCDVQQIIKSKVGAHPLHEADFADDVHSLLRTGRLENSFLQDSVGVVFWV